MSSSSENIDNGNAEGNDVVQHLNKTIVRRTPQPRVADPQGKFRHTGVQRGILRHHLLPVSSLHHARISKPFFLRENVFGTVTASTNYAVATKSSNSRHRVVRIPPYRCVRATRPSPGQ